MRCLGFSWLVLDFPPNLKCQKISSIEDNSAVPFAKLFTDLVSCVFVHHVGNMPVWLLVPLHRRVKAWGGPSGPGLLLILAHSVNQPWDAGSACSHTHCCFTWVLGVQLASSCPYSKWSYPLSHLPSTWCFNISYASWLFCISVNCSGCHGHPPHAHLETQRLS